MKEWQFNVLFFVGVGGAVLLLIGPSIGLDIGQNPTTVTGVGAILTYILTQRKTLTNKTNGKNGHTKPENDKEEKGGEGDIV